LDERNRPAKIGGGGILAISTLKTNLPRGRKKSREQNKNICDEAALGRHPPICVQAFSQRVVGLQLL